MLTALSLRTLLAPAAPAPTLDPEKTPGAAIAFPGLFPPIAVSVPLIFATPFPGLDTKVGILTLGLALVTVNWLQMRRSKAILRADGPVALQHFGAVFGVLQLALAIQLILNAVAML